MLSFHCKQIGNSLLKELLTTVAILRAIQAGRQGPAGQSRPSPEMAKSTKRIAFDAYQPSAFRMPCLRFSVIFLSCKANARVYERKSGHGPHSPTPKRRGFTKAPAKCRFCDSASLGSEPGQPTNQSLSLPQSE